MAAAKKPAAKATPAKNALPTDSLKERAAQSQKVAGKEGKDNTHKYSPKWKAPKNLAAGADLLWKAQQSRAEAQKAVDKIADEESDLKAWLIENLPKSDANGISGKLCRVTVVKKEVPRVENWPKFYENIVARYTAHKKRKDGQEDGAFALLQRRVGEAAVKEAWENGEGVMGVGKFTTTSLSINKV